MPPPRRDGHTDDATDALIAVAPLVTRMVERLLIGTESPLTLAQFLVLRGVDGGVASNAEIARAAGVSDSAASQLIAALVGAGLVERHEFAGDRRRISLRLSELGAQTLARTNAMLRAELGMLMGELAPHELDALIAGLGAISSTLSGIAPPRRPHPPRPPGRQGPSSPPEPPGRSRPSGPVH